MSDSELVDRLLSERKELRAFVKKIVDYHKYVQKNHIWDLTANAQVDLLQLLREGDKILDEIKE